MEMIKVKGVIEALLFVSDKPLSAEKMLEILKDDVNKKDIIGLIEELNAEYSKENRSFRIQEIGQGYIVSTISEYADWIKKLYKSKIIPRLSKPALETLSIIAYRQPITRLEIEGVRGVNVGGVLQTLLERNLIKIRGRKEGLGRPLLYGTTNEFLQYFGLKDLTELPRIEELSDVLAGGNKNDVTTGTQEIQENQN
ncbi:MAG: SMC-Scp complex subunit ScpB [Candidatus Firestonebacteria bacterium]